MCPVTHTSCWDLSLILTWMNISTSYWDLSRIPTWMNIPTSCRDLSLILTYMNIPTSCRDLSRILTCMNISTSCWDLSRIMTYMNIRTGKRKRCYALHRPCFDWEVFCYHCHLLTLWQADISAKGKRLMGLQGHVHLHMKNNCFHDPRVCHDLKFVSLIIYVKVDRCVKENQFIIWGFNNFISRCRYMYNKILWSSLLAAKYHVKGQGHWTCILELWH